ncbi:MAG: helix-turn-helix domain-containing protein [Rubripirellula sp.]
MQAMGSLLDYQLTDRALPENLPPWGVLVLESHHSPKFAMSWRTHEFVKIVYVWKGRGEFHIGDEIHNFDANDVIVIPPNTRNRIIDDTSAAPSLYVCCISTQLFNFEPCLVESLNVRLINHRHGFTNRITSLLRRLIHSQQRPVANTSISMVANALRLLQIVLELESRPQAKLPSNRNERSVLQRYIAELPDHFFEESSIDSTSQRLGIPRRTFTQLFHELTGETWLSHTRRLAIEHAQQRLCHTELPITSIAFECGFHDLSTFYRQFKKFSGMSPGEYRSTKS